MPRTAMTDTLTKLAAQYPPDLRDLQQKDVRRIAFNITLALECFPDRTAGSLSICDIGGGIGLFSAGCAAIGMKRVLLVDDFGDVNNRDVAEGTLALHRRLGVEVHSRDVIAQGVGAICSGLDIVTTFDSMEHWHHSPKRLFKEVADGLVPGGAFILGVPNCVNLRKRISVPFGVGKWSPMEEWYERESFRAHVREPDVEDLRYIARDMGLTDVRILGRNWLGYMSGRAAVRLVTALVDVPLRLKPSFCADIYVVGRKPR